MLCAWLTSLDGTCATDLRVEQHRLTDTAWVRGRVDRAAAPVPTHGLHVAVGLLESPYRMSAPLQFGEHGFVQRPRLDVLVRRAVGAPQLVDRELAEAVRAAGEPDLAAIASAR